MLKNSEISYNVKCEIDLNEKMRYSGIVGTVVSNCRINEGTCIALMDIN